MSEHDAWREMAPLHALGALDCEDERAFRAHAQGCAECREEVAVHEAVAAAIGLGGRAVAPPPRLRRRVLAAIDPDVPAGGFSRWPMVVALAAAALLGVSTAYQASRAADLQRELAEARTEVTRSQAAVQSAQTDLAAARAAAVQPQAVAALLARSDARVTALAGLPAAPDAHGRVVWNPGSREAVLTATGLRAAETGKVYQAWVIAEGPPVPAGVFQVDARGEAVLLLPTRDATARAKTFAVTVEPAPGTEAPTGPMVLAGATTG